MSRGLRRFVQTGLRFVWESFEALLTDVLFVSLEIRKNFGRVARNTQTGADDQKGQNEQKPPRAVDGKQIGVAKHVGPERAKLVDIIVGRLVLLDHGANHRGDANHRQQGDRKAHGRQQLDHVAQTLGAGAQGNTLGRNGHARRRKNVQKKGAPVIFRARPAQSQRPTQSSRSERSARIVPANINGGLYPCQRKVNRGRPCPRHQRKPAM